MTDLGSMSIEDALAHYGVKGMKWGQRRAGAPTASDVYAARRKVDNDKRSVKSAKRKLNAAKRPETKLKRKLEYQDTKAKFLNNPDRATAQRITKGDVYVTGLLAASGLLTPAAAAAGIGAGAAKRVATRKVIEKRQKSGSYTKAANNRKANARNAAR